MKKRVFSSLLAVVLMSLIFVLPILNSKLSHRGTAPSQTIDKASKSIVDKPDETSDPKPSSQAETNEDVTYLVTLPGDALIDTVIASRGKYADVKTLLLSADGKQYVDVLKKNQAVVKASIQKLVPGSDFTGCYTYLAALNGFTVKAPANTEEKLKSINGVSGVKLLSARDYFFTEEDPLSQSTDSSSTDPQQETSLSEGTEEETETDTDRNGEVQVYSENAAYPSRLSAVPKQVIHAEEAYEAGLSGKSTVIAVLDTEFNVRHEAFSAQPEETALSKEELTTLYRRIFFNTGSLSEKNVPYVSRKIAFAYDYAGSTASTRSESLDHGTAVAAAAAGNNGKTGEEAYSGVAYDAQLALMKVCPGRDSDGRCYTEPPQVLAALDDALKLGADVICMSFGQYRSSDNGEIYAPVLADLRQAGIPVVCPSGNGSYNGSSSGTPLRPEDIDYGTGNYLSALEGVLAVGSVENQAVETRYFVAGGQEITYTDLCENSLDRLRTTGGRLPYVCLNADGNREDYYNEETSGKLVLINRSELSADKVYESAVDHGAAALAVINGTEEGDYRLEAAAPSIPMILLGSEWTSYFGENPNGEILLMPYGIYTERTEPTTVAAHTSYEALAGLQLSHRVLAPGEAVYAPSADGGTGAYSGSSLACAQGAGVCALLSQASGQSSQREHNLSQTARALLMSTAELIEAGKNTAEEVLYVSPRLQGAGTLRVDRAVTAAAYLTNGEDEPFAESIGDGVTGEYRFSFRVHNLSSEELTLTPSVSLQTDRYRSDSDNTRINTLKPYSLRSMASVRFLQEGKEITFLTVEAGETASVETVMTLDSYEAERLLQFFTSGYYLDGFLLLRDQSGILLHGAFTGFFGDLSEISPFDSTVYDEHQSVSGLESSFCAAAFDGDKAVSCRLIDRDGQLLFSPKALAGTAENTALSGASLLPDFYLLRDVYETKVSVLTEQGTELFSCSVGKLSAYRDRLHRPYEAFSGHAAELERFFAGLKDGSYRYRITCRVMGANRRLSQTFTKELPFIVDSVKPEDLKSRTYLEGGRIVLELTARDASGIADFNLYATAYNRSEQDYRYADRLSELIAAGYIAEGCYSLIDKNSFDNGTTIYRYDITNLSAELNKLKLRTSSWVNKSSSLTIAYKALDNAYNESDARTADAIVYGSASFSFTDQNGKPAAGLTVVLDGRKSTSDQNGILCIDRLKPDYYIAELVYDKDLYTPEHTRFLICISNDALQFQTRESVTFLGEYPPEESESQNSLTSPVEQQLTRSDASSPQEVDTDNTVFAILFVCFLLAIGGVTLLARLKLRSPKQ